MQSRLVDRRNFEQQLPILLTKVGGADIFGFDIETQDWDTAHSGIRAYRKKDTAKVFDYRRTTITGFSFYVDGDDVAYYVNLAHDDVKNRLTWPEAKQILDARKPTALTICHNAPFELTMMQNNLGFFLGDNVICTLQMAVSAYGPDEYPIYKFDQAGLDWIAPLLPAINQQFSFYDRDKGMTPEQEELLFKVIGKSSTSSFSYNGFANELAYGYGLKKLVKSFFNYRMTTFEEVLNGKNHMGELTGDEVVAYGADDSYWAVRVFHELLKFMAETNPGVIDTFFQQENPMIYIFAGVTQGGMKVNFPAIEERQKLERENFAAELRKLKGIVNSLLPFDTEPSEGLMEYEKWYQTGWKKYREKIVAWARMPDKPGAYEQIQQVRSAVGNAWANDVGQPESNGMNIGHYMPMRVLLYDLLRERPMVMAGKVQSDADNRGRLMARLEKAGADANKKALLLSLTKLASIETTMKLFLTPYMKLTDPDTGYLYPVLSSMLATRRMGARFPNPMQLTKQGESVYVRGFFEPDHKDHLLVSLDWSQIELVIIGDQSGDPEFAKAYAQLPYNDLHLGAAADILSAIYDTTVTEEQFKSLKSMPDDVESPFGFPLVDATGSPLTPKKAYAFNRGTAGGKGANFGYWYSGSLASVATTRGVGSELMWKMTDAYRARFEVAEGWRLAQIDTASREGRVILPDGHSRVKYEATMEWQIKFIAKFQASGNNALTNFARLAANKISKRAGRQVVNAMVQGTCATLAKRSIVRMHKENPDLRWRFLIPIHDEVVFSVHKDDVVAFIQFAKSIMNDHPDIIRTLKMNCTAAVGRTFQPFHFEKKPFGQIELDELPTDLEFIPDEFRGKAANDDIIQSIVDYLVAA